jgi:murein DD-endopeptidase MepM/ murein hydrolase activator NlpD
MACIYYSDQFLTANSKVPNNPDLTNRIIGEISTSVNPALKFEYLAYLDSQVPSGNKKMTLPLEQINFGKGYNHTDALDLFIPEGSPIMSMAEGIVLVADKNWQANKPMSSSSHNGGNTVVIYSPTTQRFFRYAHLSEVKVNVGQKISAGTEIGKVGHTGKNANKPGHGGHLHLDVNKINPAEKKVYSQNFMVLAQTINQIKATPRA